MQVNAKGGSKMFREEVKERKRVVSREVKVRSLGMGATMDQMGIDDDEDDG